MRVSSAPAKSIVRPLARNTTPSLSSVALMLRPRAFSIWLAIVRFQMLNVRVIVRRTFLYASTTAVLLGLYALLQLARLWVIVSLGEYWTTRIITLDAIASGATI